MLNNQHNQSSSKFRNGLDEQGSFENCNSDEQASPFGMSAKASPAISNGLPKLNELLTAQGVQVKSFDELYVAAVNIIKFVACKERQTIINNQEKK